MIQSPIGLQVGIFGGRFDLKTQPDAVLDAARRSGYSSVEYGLDDILDPTSFRDLLDTKDLALAAVHVTIWAFQDIPALAAKLGALRCADVCNSGVLVWDNFTPADFIKGAKLLNEAGRSLREIGAALHYHNHAFEFSQIGPEGSGMDILLDNLDPESVDLCVDIAWVAKGGKDPATFLTEHANRIGYLHLKDYRGDEWLPLGRGEMDIPAVLKARQALPNLRQTVVEQDSTTGDPELNAAASHKYLNEARLVQS
jgi:sugar phosphate isomerase/epimerase